MTKYNQEGVSLSEWRAGCYNDGPVFITNRAPPHFLKGISHVPRHMEWRGHLHVTQLVRDTVLNLCNSATRHPRAAVEVHDRLTA